MNSFHLGTVRKQLNRLVDEIAIILLFNMWNFIITGALLWFNGEKGACVKMSSTGCVNCDFK